MKQLTLIKENINLDGVGQLDITWDFDQDEYQEWLSDTENDDTDKSLEEYINDYVSFDIEYFDNDTFHHMGYDSASYEELEYEFGVSMAKRIVNDIKESGQSSIETTELYNSTEFNINNPDELNSVAMKILNHGEYYKGCRGFILSNGVIVYTPHEHNQVSQINGVKDTFDFIRLGNIRILNKSIDLSKPPTQEQRSVLRQVIASYSDEELYLDIMADGGEVSSHYIKPDWRYVMGEIDRFFSDGIRPSGKINESISSMENVRVSGMCDQMVITVNNDKTIGYSYSDSTAYPFVIFEGKLYIGNRSETHSQLTINIPGAYENEENVIYGRIWVSAKSNEFNYAVVAFWGVDDSNTNCKPYVYEVAKKLKVNPNKIVIVVDYWNDMTIEPLESWNGFIHKIKSDEKEQKNLHMMNAKDKHNNTGDFRSSRDKKIGEKLTNEKGEEMPVAKYHNMIYQEGKEIKNIILSENQYNRLFKKTTKNIRINEDQYNRIFRH